MSHSHAMGEKCRSQNSSEIVSPQALLESATVCKAYLGFSGSP